MSIEEYILKHFRYNADGTLTRDDRKNSNGSIDRYGYLILKIKGHQFKAHRVVWLLHIGSFPKSELDHINRNKLDNRIENLRESNRTQQNRNKEIKVNAETGVRGVYIDHATKGLKKRYVTRVNGRMYRFYNLADAVKARRELLGKEQA